MQCFFGFMFDPQRNFPCLIDFASAIQLTKELKIIQLFFEIIRMQRDHIYIHIFFNLQFSFKSSSVCCLKISLQLRRRGELYLQDMSRYILLYLRNTFAPLKTTIFSTKKKISLTEEKFFHTLFIKSLHVQMKTLRLSKNSPHVLK